MESPPHLALDARQATAAGLGLAERLAIAAAVLARQAQLVQLPLLLLVDLLDAGGLEERVPLLGGVRMQEGRAVLHVDAAQVDLGLGDVVQRQAVSLLGLHGAVLCQLGYGKKGGQRGFFFLEIA